ncbi:MAG: lipoprotein [Bifidobacteriaceae bacterium]|jgi:hypothetical protein|nr:lipoprotein [Bifidobacteriaceae bacterium]
MMRRSVHHLVLALGAVALLAGCSDAGNGVASIATPGPSDSAQTEVAEDFGELVAEQSEVTDLFIECLTDNDIEPGEVPVAIGGYGETLFRAILPKLGAEPFVTNLPKVGGLASEGAPEIDEDEVVLIVGGIDRSDVLIGCIDTTGYFVPEPVFDPGDEAVQKQAEAEAANEWAACARENGIPDVLDAEVIVDGFTTRPGASVPGSTSVETFKDTLNECPPIDPDRDLTVSNTDPLQATWVDPWIVFTPTDDETNPPKLQAALDEHQVKLWEEASR